MDQYITQERMKSLLSYNPSTGEFLWLKTNSNRNPAGSVAGYINRYGYRAIRIDNISYRAHRLAFLYMNGSFPVSVVDHINGDKSDNRLDNLRECSFADNSHNIKKAFISNKSSGLLGVTWDKSRGLWSTKIRVRGKMVFIGRFKDPNEAHLAYISAKRALHNSCTI